MLRRLAHAVGCLVGFAACRFDADGAGGAVNGGLGDAGSSGDALATGTHSSSTEASDTQVSGGGTEGDSTEGDSSEADSSEDGSSTSVPESSSTAEPPDPCAIDNGGCEADATCSPDPSGEVAVCDCNEGFEGNGLVCLISPSLPMLRVEADCGTAAFGYCTASDAETEVQLVGEPGLSYVVTLRVRGVVETKAYDGGQPDGLWHPDGEAGFADLWNEVTLSISGDPQGQSIRLNSGESGGNDLVMVDMTHEVTIAAGATVGLLIDTIDGSQVDNNGDVVVPGIPPAPDAFDGQFVQIDAVSIAAQ